MAPFHQAWQGLTVTLLRKRCPCKLISQFNVRETPSLLFHLHNMDTDTHSRHILATNHVGVSLWNGREGLQTGTVSTFHKADTVTYTHIDSSPVTLSGSLSSLQFFLSATQACHCIHQCFSLTYMWLIIVFIHLHSPLYVEHVSTDITVHSTRK